jgi:hypothetical protein
MDNYPDGTSASDPRAPWNTPDTEKAQGFAIRQVIGENAELTGETLAEFIGDVDAKRQPMLTKTPDLTGPISTAELLHLMLDRRNNDKVIAAATRELASRYLDCGYTRSVIEAEIERFTEVPA